VHLRSDDGSAGDADYGQVGGSYSQYRRPDPRLAARIEAALGDARTILNVGAGAGSYEPVDRDVDTGRTVGVHAGSAPDEPGGRSRCDRRESPVRDGSFDAAMTTFSVHQWSDLRAGLREMRRVTRGPIIILTCDPDLVQRFWLNDYAPEVLDTEARRYPSIDTMSACLGGSTESVVVSVPLDCVDGFNEAYYGRPEALLDPAARLSCSAWSFVGTAVHDRFTVHLNRDLADGTWDGRFGHLRTQPTFDGSLVLVVSTPYH
jgi:hypothetical protein